MRVSTVRRRCRAADSQVSSRPDHFSMNGVRHELWSGVGLQANAVVVRTCSVLCYELVLSMLLYSKVFNTIGSVQYDCVPFIDLCVAFLLSHKVQKTCTSRGQVRTAGSTRPLAAYCGRYCVLAGIAKSVNVIRSECFASEPSLPSATLLCSMLLLIASSPPARACRLRLIDGTSPNIALVSPKPVPRRAASGTKYCVCHLTLQGIGNAALDLSPQHSSKWQRERAGYLAVHRGAWQGAGPAGSPLAACIRLHHERGRR